MAASHLLDTSVFSQPLRDRPLNHVLECWSQLAGAPLLCWSART